MVATTFASNLGHQEDARTILFEKERLQRQARRARAKKPTEIRPFPERLFALDNCRYGLHPLRSFGWLLLF